MALISLRKAALAALRSFIACWYASGGFSLAAKAAAHTRQTAAVTIPRISRPPSRPEGLHYDNGRPEGLHHDNGRPEGLVSEETITITSGRGSPFRPGSARPQCSRGATSVRSARARTVARAQSPHPARLGARGASREGGRMPAPFIGLDI